MYCTLRFWSRILKGSRYAKGYEPHTAHKQKCVPTSSVVSGDKTIRSVDVYSRIITYATKHTDSCSVPSVHLNNADAYPTAAAVHHPFTQATRTETAASMLQAELEIFTHFYVHR